MNEYEVDLGNGIKTTMQLSDEDAAKYKSAKKIGKVDRSEPIRPEGLVEDRETAEDREVEADATAARRSRGSKETR